MVDLNEKYSFEEIFNGKSYSKGGTTEGGEPKKKGRREGYTIAMIEAEKKRIANYPQLVKDLRQFKTIVVLQIKDLIASPEFKLLNQETQDDLARIIEISKESKYYD